MPSQRATDSPLSGLGAAAPFPGLRTGAGARLTWAPAKVNLFLEVLGKRADGFHELNTLIAPVSVYDTLEVRATDGEFTLECDPPTLPTGPGNLVWKAADALRRAFGVTAGAAVRLVKRIPHEAGLGGGSSDAAAVIAVLNELWGLNRSASELLPVAAEVGSDVGAFLLFSPPYDGRAGGGGSLTIPPPGPPLVRGGEDRRAAWCTGRGEIVTPAAAGGSIPLVIVKPPVGCPTAEVYKRVTVPTNPTGGEAARAAVASGDPAAVAAALHNGLQEAAFALQPTVRRVYDRLAACEPLGVLLGGSGACVFAVARDAADAARIARRFAADTADDRELAGSRTYTARTV